ncbi:MAG: SpoIID/LytB domain-containing protein [Actinobacteria bacterium]|nr:SpoIID/LytB domain-containing protein [Actinomycetota bacterium]
MRKRITAVLALATVLALAPSLSAQAGNTFTFYGGGWGHGVGMPQWGAYGLALEGWTYEEILTHYYTGTTVGPAPWKPARVRVGLTYAQGDLHLTAEGGAVEIRVGQPNVGKLVGRIPGGKTWTVEPEAGQFRVTNAKGTQVGGKLWGSTTEHLFARYVPNGSRVRIAETGHAYSRGWVEMNVYGCSACAQLLRAVASVPQKQYGYGVAEVYNGWPDDALRTQSVATRTLAFEKILRLGQNRALCNCGVWATTSDQVYFGYDKEAAAFGDRWVAAVDATAGEVILRGGEMIQSYFHAASGGFTEDVENVWGGSALSYLRGVCDPGDWTTGNSFKSWSVTKSGFTAGNQISSYIGRDIGNVTAFTNIVRGVSGRIVTVTAQGTLGSATLTGPQFRIALGLQDSKAWINADRRITGDIREKYDAEDCAPGLPTTAQAAVADGARQRFVVGAIYRNDIRGVTRWVHGPIYDKYRDFGEVGSLLGLPRSNVQVLLAAGGEKVRFEGGFIYWSEATGAHELHGAVFTYFKTHGNAGGALGFPTSDVVVEADGTEWATFQGGTVTCPPGGVCTQS